MKYLSSFFCLCAAFIEELWIDVKEFVRVILNLGVLQCFRLLFQQAELKHWRNQCGIDVIFRAYHVVSEYDNVMTFTRPRTQGEVWNSWILLDSQMNDIKMAECIELILGTEATCSWATEYSKWFLGLHKMKVLCINLPKSQEFAYH